MPVGLPADPENARVERNESIAVRRQMPVELHVSALAAEMVPPACAAVQSRTVRAVRGEMIVGREGRVVMPARQTCT